MNGTAGFQEVQSSTSRLQSYRFLHEQRHQFGPGSRHLLRTHNLIALSTSISTKRKMFLAPFSSYRFEVTEDGKK
jgi:hypothetical protein